LRLGGKAPASAFNPLGSNDLVWSQKPGAWSVTGLMTRLARVSSLSLLLACLTVPCLAQQAAFEDVIRNLRNPDTRARLGAVRMLRESRHVEAAGPVAAVVNDPIDEIQLEAIAAELSFFLVQDVPARKRVGLVVEVRSKGQAAQAFDQGPLATWPRPAPPEVLDALLKAVDDENPRVRIEAIYALGVVARPPLAESAADRLIKALDHYDPAIRAAAARVAGRLDVERAGDTLIKSINDSSPPVRYASMRALGEIRDERAVQALMEQFKYYGKGEGAWSALDALARIAHASSTPVFKSHIADKDPFMRRAAAEGLARIGDASEVATLQTAVASESSDMVRAAMTFAMVKFGQKNYLTRLLDFFGSDRTALQVQEYLLEMGPSVLPNLTSGLKEPVAGVRAGVAEIIGALGTSESIAALEPLTKDRDRGVAETAVAAIERIKMRPR
jgi:HEAT repeat protein